MVPIETLLRPKIKIAMDQKNFTPSLTSKHLMDTLETYDDVQE